jgi:hypothetical protein
MHVALSPKQNRQAEVARFVSMVFLTTFAMFGLLALVGMNGVWLKLWVGLCCAIPVNLYSWHLSRRSRQT